jgi:hypothetical protein
MNSGHPRTLLSRLLAFFLSTVLLILVVANVGCVTAKMNTSSGGGGSSASGSLSVGPSTMNFDNVTVGSSKSQTGTLSATSSGVTIQTASWNGTGFSVSGISFPVTVAAAQSVPFTVTFAPQVTGAATGSISFLSDATNSPGNVALSGTGAQTTQHSVSLTWNASTSSVQGYYIYRGTISGGPYTRLSALESGLSYVDSTAASGQPYYYAVTAVDAANTESVYSNQATVVIP